MEKEITFDVVLLEDGNYQLKTEGYLSYGSAPLGEIVGAIIERILFEREKFNEAKKRR